MRLTFGDAEAMNGAVPYAAAAEDPATGAVAGSAPGALDSAGSARWANILDESGASFRARIAGLSHDPHTLRRVHFVTDDADAAAPSALFGAALHGPWPFVG